LQKALYIEADSLLHRFHPGTKVLLLVGYFATALVLRGWVGQWVLLVAMLALGLLSGAGPNLKVFWKFLTIIAAMTVLLWSVYEGGFARATVARSLEFAGRICGMLIAGLVFLSVTPVEEFTYALGRARVPAPVTMAMGLAFRFVPILIGTASTVVALQSLRGLDLRRGSPLARVRKYPPLLVPVLITALRNVPQLAMALEGRGFGLGGSRTPFRLYPLRGADGLALTVLAVLLAATALWTYGR